MTNLKLIATDVDGTLFDSEHTYDHERLNNYLKKLHQQDVKFFVASGNSYSHLTAIFSESPLIDGFIAENGAQINVGGKFIDERTIAQANLNQIIPVLNSKLNLTKLFLSGKKATYSTNKFDDIDHYYHDNLVHVDTLENIDDVVYKINIQLVNSNLIDAVKFINDNYSHLVYAAVSGFGSIDIIPINTNKGTAITDLCDYYKISTSDVIAFGDNGNDLEMIKVAGTGVAMKNAVKDIKQASNLITKDDNDHDGVLNTIAEIFDI